MKYLFFLNTQTDFLSGYRQGDKLELAYAGEVEVPSHLSSPEACMHAGCDTLFETFNIDHPNDYRNRSMSVGDVVILGSNRIAYACESIGWKEIPLPAEAEGVQ
jgi:hypothetical protein